MKPIGTWAPPHPRPATAVFRVHARGDTEIDPEELVAAVFGTLAVGDASRAMMVEQWRGDETLRPVRRDPIETASTKVLPLHILGPRERLPR